MDLLKEIEKQILQNKDKGPTAYRDQIFTHLDRAEPGDANKI